MSYYPIFLDINEKPCTVVGGGTVALRKVNALLDHGARVEVISPELCSELREFSAKGKVKAIEREYKPGDLEGTFLAVVATDNRETNEEVAKEAGELGILINVVDIPKLSNFIVPSYLRSGDLAVAISTNGKSPALARKIRSEMEKTFGNEYAMLTSVIDQVRSELKQQQITITGEKWQQALDLEPLLEPLRQGQPDKARKKLLDNLLDKQP